MADTTPPTIAIAADKSALNEGGSAKITFTLSEPVTDFVFSDITYSGGTLSNFTGSGASYSATFTPPANSTSPGSVSVGNFKFSDAAGNANNDGEEANNRLEFMIDTVPPTVSIATSELLLGLNETAKITFNLSESSSNFDKSDVSVTNGVLLDFQGAGKVYTATLLPSIFDGTIVVAVENNRFTDALGNSNASALDNGSRVDLIVDGAPPGLKIKTTRNHLLKGEMPVIVFEFSEPVTGFDVGDIILTSGEFSQFKGSGSIYEAVLKTDGISPLELLVPVGAVSDLAGNKTVSNTESRIVPYSESRPVIQSITAIGEWYTKDYINDLVVSENGEIIFLATFRSRGTPYDSDVILGRVDSNGSLNSLLTLPTAGAGEGVSIDFSIDNGFFALVKPLPSSVPSVTPKVYLFKLDALGATQWARTVDFATLGVSSLTTTKDGSVLILSRSLNTSLYNSDLSITRLSKDGVILWSKTFGTDKDDYGVSIAESDDGSIFVAGYTEGAFSEQRNNGGLDTFLARFSPEGNQQWVRMNGSVARDVPTCLAIDINGDVFVGGSTDGPINGRGVVGGGLFGSDGFLTRFSSAGEIKWTTTFGTNGIDIVKGLSLLSDGSLYVCGTTNGNLDSLLARNGVSAAFVSKLSADGEVIWVDQFGDNTTTSEAEFVKVGKSGLLHLAIKTGSPVSVRSFEGQPVIGSGDIFLITMIDTDFKFYGTSGNDNLVGRNWSEVFRGFEGSDTVDGGDGIDTAVFEKARSSYKTEKLIQDGTTLWKVTDLATGDVDELRSIEKLEFAKATLPGSANPVQTEVSLDVEGTPSVAYRLYRAAFNRDPDLAGLGYWIDVLTKTYNPALAPDQNQVLLDSARDFVGSAEFKSIYGDTVSNATYVLNLYKNTLGRDPLAINPQTGKAFDAPGYEYWLSVLDQGYTSRQHMFVFFSESTENKAAVAPIIATGVEYVPFVPPGT